MLDLKVVTVVLLVLFAGCSGTLQEETSTPTPTTDQTETTTTEATTTPTEVTTATTTTTEATTTVEEDTVENPWNRQNVTVAVVNKVNQSRDFEPLVNESLAYWNENASKYGTYNVTFVSEPDNWDVDIVVEFVTNIEECSDDDPDTTVGCAPILDPWDTPDRREYVELTIPSCV